MMESSVEELIAAPILGSFRAEGDARWLRASSSTLTSVNPSILSLHSNFSLSGFNFSSSGREDVDVRTLGDGNTIFLKK